MKTKPYTREDVDDMREWGDYPDTQIEAVEATVEAVERAEVEVDRLRAEVEELRIKIANLEAQLNGKIPNG